MNDEAIKALEDLGFRNQWRDIKFSHGEYYNEDLTLKVCLKGDGIYAYTVGTHENADYLEMHLNFIPEDEDILKYLIRRVFYLN
jgi:hypothetical protein